MIHDDDGALDSLMADAEALENYEAKVDEVKAMDLKVAVDRMHALKLMLDQLEETRKSTQQEYDMLRKGRVPELMKKIGIANDMNKGSFTFGGGRVNLRTDTYVSCPEGKKPELLAFLEEKGDGSLIKKDVHPATLKAHVKALREKGDDARVPPMLSVHTEVSAVITRGK